MCNYVLWYCGQYQQPDVTLKNRPDQTYFLLPSLTTYCDVLPLLTAPTQQGQFVWAWKRPDTFLNLRSSRWKLVGLYRLKFRPCHGFTANLDHRLVTLLCHCICCQNSCGAHNVLPSHGAMSIQWYWHGLQFLYLWCRMISQVCVPLHPQSPCMHPCNH
jgi:hypothetical protein